MKWKRYQLIGMGAGALVFATVAGVSFLLGTSAGLRVLSSGAEWAVDGLKVGDVSGSLLHLRLSDVRYEAPGIRFKADRFFYDVAGRAVFSNRIVVDDVRLAGAEIVVRTKELPPSAETSEEPSAPPAELRAPLPFFLLNVLILRPPGSGKSFAAKREMANAFLITDDDIIICDPEAEYFSLVQRLNGQVIRLSPTGRGIDGKPQYVNPMDINLNYSEDDSPLALKSDFILSLCELVIGGKEGLQPVEKTVIDRAVRNVYRPFLADPDPEKMPVYPHTCLIIPIQSQFGN